MQIEDECRQEVRNRLNRAEGQIRGILNMIEEGRDCSDILMQIAAVSKAIDSAGLRIVTEGMRQCAAAEVTGEEPPMDRDRLEKLFLSLS